MARMEIITRTERRRRYSEVEKAALMAETDVPGRTVAEVARRHGMAESLLYNWRACRRARSSLASEPLQFFFYGEVADAVTVPPAIPAVAPPRVPAIAPPPTVRPAPALRAREEPMAVDDLVRPHPGARPGAIAIDLTTGVRLVVDSYVNEKALARVLRSLREASC